ncbi:MAG TPA: GMC family oxidoreductase N-terminal domain-containing protein [Pseudonocardia sp.]|nr:GMC family oxidoreductase N-terminal domain-containing protein [Pseudonocardia sp.]
MSYDFVVVGAGTAGCVLAARLSEDPGTRVLLLEAGSARLPAITPVPPAWPGLLGTPANWGELTTAQASTGTAVPLPRGKGLGGSSAINGMIFARGHRSSYDAWPSAGAKGWGFDDLLPYLRRSEHTDGRDEALRGVGGPLGVGPARPGSPVLAAGLAAALEVGYRPAADVSGGLEEGFGWADLNIVDGRRQSAYDAYLEGVRRPNLTVVADAEVRRLRLVGDRCTGLEYVAGGELVAVSVEREVVLAAGAIGSPKLLMLSGIGPAGHLRAVGVPVSHDLPGVGANLHDHPASGVVYRPSRPMPALVSNHGEVIGLVSSEYAVEGPDLQFLLVDVPISATRLSGLAEVWAVRVSSMRPHSRGSVRLAGADPTAAPVLDPNYYADERDVAVMAAGLRIARRIGAAPALADWRAEEVEPGPSVVEEAALRAFVRDSLGSYSHPVGTCRIGDPADAATVVDPELRVLGLRGLRVADASVMPSIVSANTNCTVFGIAERAAELIAAG